MGVYVGLLRRYGRLLAWLRRNLPDSSGPKEKREGSSRSLLSRLTGVCFSCLLTLS